VIFSPVHTRQVDFFLPWTGPVRTVRTVRRFVTPPTRNRSLAVPLTDNKYSLYYSHNKPWHHGRQHRNFVELSETNETTKHKKTQNKQKPIKDDHEYLTSYDFWLRSIKRRTVVMYQSAFNFNHFRWHWLEFWTTDTFRVSTVDRRCPVSVRANFC